MSKSVKRLLRYSDLLFFQDDNHPLSWICGAHFVNNPQIVFGSLYYCAKFGWNRCSGFDRSLNILHVWLENAYSCHQIGVLGGI